MKRVIFLTILSFGIAGFASAQTTTTLSSSRAHAAKAHMIRGTGAKHKRPTHFSNIKSKKSTPAKTTALDNRKNYNWSNGQSSTPTGKDAASVNGGYAALQKDPSTKGQVKKHN